MRLVLLVLLVACGSHDAPHAPEAAPAPAPPPVDPLTVIRGLEPQLAQEIRDTATSPQYIPRAWGVKCPDTGAFTLWQGCKSMPHAVVRTFAGKMWIAIGKDRAPPCTGQPFVDHSQDIVAFEIPAGPGATFYVGQPFGTHTQIELADDTFANLQMNDVAVDLAPFTLEVGGQVKGAIAIDGYGDGRFAATVCPDQQPIVDALPVAPAPDTPLGGTLDGVPFHGTVAHAKVSTQAHTTIVHIGVVDPANGDPGCGRPDDWIAQGLIVGGGGVAAPFAFPGRPQPLFAEHDSDTLGPQTLRGTVVWDQVETSPGGTIRAHVVIASPAEVPADQRIDLSGTIAAIVCP